MFPYGVERIGSRIPRGLRLLYRANALKHGKRRRDETTSNPGGRNAKKERDST
jgi:hypothetical protein